MTPSYPPQSRRDAEIDGLVDVLACATGGHNGVYVSAPITTGRRYAQWSARAGPRPGVEATEIENEHRNSVIEPNLSVIRPFVDRLRPKLKRTVIDPTVLKDRKGWNQDDYRQFWARVIEKLAVEVIFMNEWQYSEGCTYEFLTACKCGASTLHQDLSPLRPQVAISMIQQALSEIGHLPSGSFLRGVLADLKNLNEYRTCAPRS